jgi:Flp pilus assembly protein TadB
MIPMTVFLLISFALNTIPAKILVHKFLTGKNAFFTKAVHYRQVHNRPRDQKKILDFLSSKLSQTMLYQKAEKEIKKAGYGGKYHPIQYMGILYGLPVMIFLIGMINDPARWIQTVIGCSALFTGTKIYVKGKTKKITDQFEKHAWRIYRYLHNQIASGIKITDAITTVYETVNEKDIREILIKFAATFQLTMKIEEALEEINGRFGGNEAATLCMALREGVKTGDSELMLKRQEDIMFNKYFNRLEAETEKRRTFCILSAAMFCAILVILASVPIVMDLTDALGGIFTS